jgi:hypothetical protein
VVDAARIAPLLRRGEPRSPDAAQCRGQRSGLPLGLDREAEVGDGPPVAESQDVPGLEVAVEDPLVVDVRQSFADLPNQVVDERVLSVQLLDELDQAALSERHGIPDPAGAGLAVAEDRHHVRMLDRLEQTPLLWAACWMS